METTFAKCSPEPGLASTVPPAATGSLGGPARRPSAVAGKPVSGPADKAKARAGAPAKARCLIEALMGSQVYQDYARAFTEATGLLVTLRPVESWQLPFHGHKNENAFCALMAKKSRSCGVCLQVQQKLSEMAVHEPHALTCPVGFSDAAVPVRLGEQLIGFLQTGQIFRRKPTASQFERVHKLLQQWGVQEDAEEGRQA
ncbi:MAG: PocR ligand-binding domain-containing protein [Verrucomicrobia bacterium]|nr:PocR ligand-binding domain-containing protein [Verrucomicrobiota bacterium]